ncbi:hypothetical protein DMUE_1383 [Dictyocoela muelleri]|nr:hypothetical protein DMUE_1383 [Dictyocoela muelleri]
MHWRSHSRSKELNKINSNKSLYINFLVHNAKYGENPNILNSRKEKEKLINNIKNELQSVKSTIKPNENLEIATFEYKNDITGLKMLHKINILDTIENQDVFSWVLAFKEISRLCNWSNEAQIDVLKHIISIDILHNIGIPHDVEDYLHFLLKQKYNAEQVYKYSKRLSTLRQSNYYTIRKFASDIEINCRKLGICMDWSDDLIEQKIQEIFFNGLDTYSKLELSKYSKRDYKSVYESII